MCLHNLLLAPDPLALPMFFFNFYFNNHYSYLDYLAGARLYLAYDERPHPPCGYKGVIQPLSRPLLALKLLATYLSTHIKRKKEKTQENYARKSVFSCPDL